MGCAITTTIDATKEDILPLRVAARRWLPKRPSGRRLSYNSIYRWAKKGLRGVKLETVCVGGTIYTSREALARFYARLNDAHNHVRPAPLGTDHDRDDAMLTAEGL